MDDAESVFKFKKCIQCWIMIGWLRYFIEDFIHNNEGWPWVPTIGQVIVMIEKVTIVFEFNQGSCKTETTYSDFFPVGED